MIVSGANSAVLKLKSMRDPLSIHLKIKDETKTIVHPFREIQLGANVRKRIGIIPTRKTRNGVQWLIGKTPTGHIGDFGGGVKKNESLLFALKREVCEEYGPKLWNLVENKITLESAMIRARKYSYYVQLLVDITPTNNEFLNTFVKNEEVSKVMWFSRHKLLKLSVTNFHEPIRWVVKHIKSNCKES